MSMTVVGGCYHEICEHPSWRELRGSGGRAAIALSGADVELKTYYPSERLADLYPIEAFGVRVLPTSSETPVAFAYFHSLSDPAVSPAIDEIRKQAPIRAEGEVVLRFGLVEGGSIVEADRAIYDPQYSFQPMISQRNPDGQNTCVPGAGFCLSSLLRRPGFTLPAIPIFKQIQLAIRDPTSVCKIPLYENQNSCHMPAHPTPLEGRTRRHLRGAGCDGRGRCRTTACGARTAKACGPVPPTLGSTTGSRARWDGG
jgi:hypothetical protein